MVPIAVAKTWLEHDFSLDEDPWTQPVRRVPRARAMAIRAEWSQNVIMAQTSAIVLGLAVGTALWKIGQTAGFIG